MATEERDGDPGLKEALTGHPQSFLFFQAVRLLNLISLQETRGEKSQRAELDELFRFRTRPNLNFPASEVSDLRAEQVPDRQGGLRDRWEMEVTFMGLTGPSGVLPRHYTEFLVERQLKRKDNRAHAFFDLFSHRAIALFFKAWSKYRYPLHTETGKDDALLQFLLALLGMGTPALRRQLATGAGLQDGELAFYTGPLGRQPRSVEAVNKTLADYFGIPAQVRELLGRWLEVPPHSATKLGSENCKLGHSVLLGTRVWDHQSRLRVVLGPMPRDYYDDLLPGADGHTKLLRFLKWMLGPSIDFEVQLVLAKDGVRPRDVSLMDRRGNMGCRLGYFGWLGVRQADRNLDDAVFSVT
jgi:type VI secretion system protein ImpH